MAANPSAAAILSALLLVGCDRYEMVAMDDRDSVWRLDRFTGEVCRFNSPASPSNVLDPEDIIFEQRPEGSYVPGVRGPDGDFVPLDMEAQPLLKQCQR